MPIGLGVMKWNDRSGTELLIKTPDGLSLSDALLMQVYNTHEFSEQAGVTSFKNDSNNIISYYTGHKSSFYIIVVLKDSEDPDDFEEGLVKISKIIVKNKKHDVYKLLLPLLLKRMSE